MKWKFWKREDEKRVAEQPDLPHQSTRYEITDRNGTSQLRTNGKSLDSYSASQPSQRYEITHPESQIIDLELPHEGILDLDGRARITTVLAKKRGYDLLFAEPIILRDGSSLPGVRLSQQKLDYISPPLNGDQRHVSDICEFNRERLGELLEDRLGYNPFND